MPACSCLGGLSICHPLLGPAGHKSTCSQKLLQACPTLGLDHIPCSIQTGLNQCLACCVTMHLVGIQACNMSSCAAAICSRITAWRTVASSSAGCAMSGHPVTAQDLDHHCPQSCKQPFEPLKLVHEPSHALCKQCKLLTHQMCLVQVGKVLWATVQRMTNFGAFLRPEGGEVDGLLHISAISKTRVENVDVRAWPACAVLPTPGAVACVKSGPVLGRLAFVGYDLPYLPC